MSRPTKYKPDYHPQKARELAELDLNDKQIAQALNIGERTLYDWKKVYPQFSQAIEEGKQSRIRKVEESALKLALGYYQHEYEFNPDDPLYSSVGDEVKQVLKKIFTKLPKKFYKPDPKILGLMMMSLSNKYRIKTENTIIDPLRKEIQEMTPEEREAEIERLIRQREKNK